MSFILDALKKSEIERQRQTVPGLMEVGGGARRSRFPLWAVLLAVLLGVNMVVLLVLLTRHGTSAVPAAQPPAAHAAVDAPARVADHFSPLGTPVGTPGSPIGSAPVFAPEIPVPPAAAQHSPPRAARRADPLLSDAETKAETKEDNEEVLPSINQVNLTGAQALPELHLDVHVYATKPAERFVYINMRKYHEGNTLQEGPVVERIRRDGVVLNYQGLRFVLPRQS